MKYFKNSATFKMFSQFVFFSKVNFVVSIDLHCVLRTCVRQVVSSQVLLSGVSVNVFKVVVVVAMLLWLLMHTTASSSKKCKTPFTVNLGGNGQEIEIGSKETFNPF